MLTLFALTGGHRLPHDHRGAVAGEDGVGGCAEQVKRGGGCWICSVSWFDTSPSSLSASEQFKLEMAIPTYLPAPNFIVWVFCLLLRQKCWSRSSGVTSLTRPHCAK